MASPAGLTKRWTNTRAVSAHFPPAAVDHERVPPVGYLDDLGHRLVVLLLLEVTIGNGPWRRGVLLAGDDEHRPAIGVLGIHLRLGPGVDVGGGRLKEWHSRCRYCELG